MYDQATRDHIAKHRNLQQRYEKIFKADAEPDDIDEDRLDDDIDEERLDDDNGDNGNGEPRHVVDELADLMVESGSPDGNGQISREQALHYLLHSAPGQALVSRMAQARKRNRKDFQMPTRQQVLKNYLQAAGSLDKLAAQIVKRGTTDISEAELTGMITAQAQHETGLSDDRAFSRLYTDPSPRGLMLRKAINICKAAPLEIMPDSTAAGDTGVEDDSGKATAQMERLVAEQIRRSPEMTRSQAWNVVVHENPTLAASAIRRPTTNKANAFPFPR
ncbi:MAG TPA: hypothetical protein VKB56_14090 [Terriglobales bacterium]|nr:hypothetical protein [Terriglobales bacterium]